MKLLTKTAVVPFFLVGILPYTASAEDIISNTAMFGHNCNQIAGIFDDNDETTLPEVATFPYDDSDAYNFDYAWAKWTVTENSDNTYFFHIGNHYLRAAPNGNVEIYPGIGDWKKFTLEESDVGGYYLKSWRDTYLSCQDTGTWQDLTQVSVQEDATRWYFPEPQTIAISAAKVLTKTLTKQKQSDTPSRLSAPDDL